MLGIYFAFGLGPWLETAQRPRLPWRTRLDCEISRFLVALGPMRDLLICAKHLFVAARTVRHGPGAGQARRRDHAHRQDACVGELISISPRRSRSQNGREAAPQSF